MRFLPVGRRDLPRVQALAETIWREYYPPIIGAAQVEYMLATGYALSELEAQRESGVVFELIAVDGHEVGFVAFSEIGHALYKLHKLYVLAGARGRGVGQRALLHVEQHCAARGGERLELNVNKHNLRAICAYERAGFVRTAAVVIDIGHGFVMDDFRYEKLLTAWPRTDASMFGLSG